MVVPFPRHQGELRSGAHDPLDNRSLEDSEDL